MPGDNGADGVTKRQLLRGASGAIGVPLGVAGISAPGRSAEIHDDRTVADGTVRAAVREHASALIERLVADGVVDRDAFVTDDLERVDAGTALDDRRGIAVLRRSDADSGRWLLMVRDVAGGDVQVAIDRERGTAVGRVDTGAARTAYVATGDGVATTDPDSLETCHVLCTRYFCTIPPTGWGIEFRAVGVDGGPSACVPMDLTCECTPNFP